LSVSTATDVQADAACDPNDMHVFSYFLHPEFKMPKHIKDDTAVADTAGSDGVAAGAACTSEDGADDAAVADEWEWATACDESMHPCWAVRRMSKHQLARETCIAHANGKAIPRFSCKLEEEIMSCVSVGVVNERPVNVTRICKVPFLTNMVKVESGDELIMEMHEKAVGKTAGKRGWRQALKTALDAEEKKAKGSDQQKHAKSQPRATAIV